MTTDTSFSLDHRDLPQVAILGAGTMGTAMATRLLATGIQVNVWNRHPGPAMVLVGRGATAFADPRDAVSDADVVLTTLPTAEVVRSVMMDEGVLDAVPAGTPWAQMGTIGSPAMDALGADVAARRPSVSFVDAPVSGSRQPAETGQLLILAAGPRSAAERLEPVFDRLGRRTIWLGTSGMATRLKLVLNTWLAFLLEGAAEIDALADRLGVPHAVLVDALDDGPLAATLAMAKIDKMHRRDFGADFALEWALKDINLALDVSDRNTVPVASAIAERWQHVAAGGAGHLDVSAARLGLDATPASATDNLMLATTA